MSRPSLSSRTTIDIPQLHNPNVRTNYANKKFGKRKEDKLRVNLSQLNGKAVISEDLLARPRSIDQVSQFRGPRSIEGVRVALPEPSLRMNPMNPDKRKRSLPTRRS